MAGMQQIADMTWMLSYAAAILLCIACQEFCVALCDVAPVSSGSRAIRAFKLHCVGCLAGTVVSITHSFARR